MFRGLPVHHGKGWLPATLGPTTLVATPSVYKSYDDQWAVRRLREVELYEALGLPSTFVDLMLEDKFRNWKNLIPMESMVAVATCYMGIECYENGGSASAFSPRKRRFVSINGQRKAVANLMPAVGKAQRPETDSDCPKLQEVGMDERDTSRKATKADDA